MNDNGKVIINTLNQNKHVIRNCCWDWYAHENQVAVRSSLVIYIINNNIKWQSKLMMNAVISIRND